MPELTKDEVIDALADGLKRVDSLNEQLESKTYTAAETAYIQLGMYFLVPNPETNKLDYDIARHKAIYSSMTNGFKELIEKQE